MKKIISILLTFTILACSMPVIFATGGTGTEDDPYVLSSIADIKAIDPANSEGKYYVLSNDIDFGGANWTLYSSIGSAENPFKGTIDGKGYAIKNFSVSILDKGVAGLFQYIGGNAVIKNLGIEGFTGNLSTWSYGGVVGGLTAYLKDNATLQNCWAKDIVYNDKAWANQTDVGNFGTTGGLAASVDSAGVVVENCYSINSIPKALDGTAGTDGGIVGYIGAAATIRNCYSDTTVAATLTAANAVVENCYYVESGHWLGDGYNYVGEVVSADTLKGYAATLGSAFIADTTVDNVNNGYPMLACEKNRYTFYGDSEQYPISVRTVTELNSISGADSVGKYYRLENDINISGDADIQTWNGWQKTGKEGTEPFQGYFDGNGHVISNYRISQWAGNSGHGLFGEISGDGYVKNLGIEDVIVLGKEYYMAETSPAAALAGIVSENAKVIGCYGKNIKVNMNGTESTNDVQLLGGLIGGVDGAGVEIRDCYTKGTEKNHPHVNNYGDLVGKVYAAKSISNCYSDGRGVVLPTSNTTTTVSNVFYVTAGWPNTWAGTQVQADALNGKTADLGSAFIMDSPYNPVNGGYPMLAWEREKYSELDINTPGVIDSKDDMLELSSFWAADPYGLDGMYFRVDADIDLEKGTADVLSYRK